MAIIKEILNNQQISSTLYTDYPQILFNKLNSI